MSSYSPFPYGMTRRRREHWSPKKKRMTILKDAISHIKTHQHPTFVDKILFKDLWFTPSEAKVSIQKIKKKLSETKRGGKFSRKGFTRKELNIINEY